MAAFSVRAHWAAASERRKEGYRHTIGVLVVTLGFLVLGKAVLWPLNAALALLPVEVPISVDSFLVGGSAALGIVKPTDDVPITLVEIDDTLHAAWGRPCMTPREELARLIDAVAAQRPAAIVVDINLDCAPSAQGCAVGGPCDFGAFLAGYRGPAPLVLVRGMYLETAGTEARVRTGRTAYEEAIASNPLILWAHTFYLTDTDGTVRRWRDAWEACNDAGTETVLAVPIRVAAALRGTASLAHVPPRSGRCTLDTQSSPEHLVILGAPIVGQLQPLTGATAPRLFPARHLLDAEREVEQGGYFSLTDRVVIVGSTHTASGDVWRTAIGMIPGMELIAHTVRFAPTQLDLGAAERSFSGPITLAAFWTLAVLAFLLRPSLVVIIAGVLSFAAIYLATGVWARFDIFESLELSLWIFIEYAVLLAAWALVREVERYRRWRTARLMMSKRMRSNDPETKGGPS